MISMHTFLALLLAVIIAVVAYVFNEPIMLMTYAVGFGIGALMR